MGDVASKSIADYPPQENILAGGAQVGDQVADTLQAPGTFAPAYIVDPSSWGCNPNYTFAGGSVTLHGNAADYFGNTAALDLTFRRSQ
jgi:hypothetical protein